MESKGIVDTDAHAQRHDEDGLLGVAAAGARRRGACRSRPTTATGPACRRAPPSRCRARGTALSGLGAGGAGAPTPGRVPPRAWTICRARSIASGVVANRRPSRRRSSATPSATSTSSWSDGDAGEQHDDAATLEVRDRVTEHPRAGRVDRRDPRHAQDDDAHLRHVGQLEQEPVRRGEDQRPVEPVGDDVLGQQGRAPPRNGRRCSSGTSSSVADAATARSASDHGDARRRRRPP